MSRCGDCIHFIGGGDWGLCCDQKYELTYADCDSCELFEIKEGVKNGKKTNLSKNKTTQL